MGKKGRVNLVSPKYFGFSCSAFRNNATPNLILNVQNMVTMHFSFIVECCCWCKCKEWKKWRDMLSFSVIHLVTKSFVRDQSFPHHGSYINHVECWGGGELSKWPFHEISLFWKSDHHEGGSGEGLKIPKNLTTWFLNDPKVSLYKELNIFIDFYYS